MIAEIVGAHLFGLFRNLGLEANAAAVAFNVERLAGAVSSSSAATRNRKDELLNAAKNELERSTVGQPGGNRVVEFTTPDRALNVELSRDLIPVSDALSQAEDYATVHNAVDTAAKRFEQPRSRRDGNHSSDREVTLPFGVRVWQESRR